MSAPSSSDNNSDNDNHDTNSPCEYQSHTLYLIRHAETVENVRLASVARVGKSLQSMLPRRKKADNGATDADQQPCHAPAVEDVKDTLKFVGGCAVGKGVDSEVSEHGWEQMKDMRKILDAAYGPEPDDTQVNNQDDNTSKPQETEQETTSTSKAPSAFLAHYKVDMVLHSPLTRARETCRVVLGCCDNPNTSTTKPTSAPTKDEVMEVKALDCLREATPWEQTLGGKASFFQRIQELEKWLATSFTESKTLAVVGHSQYFMAMLHHSEKFRNCDVWKVTFTWCPKCSFQDEQDHQNGSTPSGGGSQGVAQGSKDGAKSEDTCCTLRKPTWTDLTLLHRLEEDNGVNSGKQQ